MKFLNHRGGLPECPYFHLLGVDFGAFAIRFHRWFADDDRRAFHDHKHWFLTLVLWGGYVDESPAGRDTLRWGSLRFRRAEYRHKVTQVMPGTVTFLITGPAVRRFSFYLPNGKAIKRDKYFVEQGHHPCNPEQEPVRLRPDGSRV